jgi:hypothetical protein
MMRLQDRWGPVALGIIDYHGGFNYSYLPVLAWLEKEVPPAAWALLDPIAELLQNGYGEYDGELKGIYAAVAAAYPWAASSGLFTLPKVLMDVGSCVVYVKIDASISRPRSDAAADHAANVLRVRDDVHVDLCERSE